MTVVVTSLACSTSFAQTAKPRPEDPLAAAEAYQQHLFEKVAPSVIFISKGDSFGSGFFVNVHGLALTNRHVVGDAKQVTVVLHDGRKLTAKVVERAKHKIDLALVQVPVRSSPALDISGFDDLRVGSWVGSVGHGVGGIWTFTKGMVSNIYPSKKSQPDLPDPDPAQPRRLRRAGIRPQRPRRRRGHRRHHRLQ